MQVTRGNSRDPRFATSNLVHLTAAVAGISRKGWTAVGSHYDLESARALMVDNRFDILPIESGHTVKGYFHTKVWNDYSTVEVSPISEADIIPYDHEMREVVKCLFEHSRLFYFLKDTNEIVGLLSVVHLNRLPVKMWLYSLLSEVEVRLGKYLTQHLTNPKLYELTLGLFTDEKYDEVKERYQKDLDKGLDLPVVEYLYFTDLISLVETEKLYEPLGYSKSQFAKSMGSLGDLRNTMAHPARSILREPTGVEKLWRRLQRIEEVLDGLRRSQTST